jgi:hypothetical protein
MPKKKNPLYIKKPTVKLTVKVNGQTDGYK